MADIFTKEQRKINMQAIKSSNTYPEILVRHALHKFGFRYRLNKHVCGCKPDIVLPKWQAVIFVHGCFWHRHNGCRYATSPKSNVDFWNTKFKRNIERDLIQINELKKNGWHVYIVWECSLKHDLEQTLNNLKQVILHKNSSYWESGRGGG